MFLLEPRNFLHRCSCKGRQALFYAVLCRHDARDLCTWCHDALLTLIQATLVCVSMQPKRSLQHKQVLHLFLRQYFYCNLDTQLSKCLQLRSGNLTARQLTSNTAKACSVRDPLELVHHVLLSVASPHTEWNLTHAWEGAVHVPHAQARSVSAPSKRAHGFVNRQMDASAPAVKIQGWLGWNAQSSTPSKSTTSCPRRILTGTISGLDSRSCACADTLHWFKCLCISNCTDA